MLTAKSYSRRLLAFPNLRGNRRANFNGSASVDGMLTQVASGGGYDAKFVLETKHGFYPAALTSAGRLVVFDAAWAFTNGMPQMNYNSDLMDTQIATLSQLNGIVGVGTAAGPHTKIEPAKAAINHIGNGLFADNLGYSVTAKENEVFVMDDSAMYRNDLIPDSTVPSPEKTKKEIIGTIITAIVLVVLFAWCYKNFID